MAGKHPIHPTTGPGSHLGPIEPPRAGGHSTGGVFSKAGARTSKKLCVLVCFSEKTSFSTGIVKFVFALDDTVPVEKFVLCSSRYDKANGRSDSN